ncbi:caspase family protein [Cyclobacterium plantarum]|uniref:Peptidase C14 caspase domain-containing protein n=1 Tax=Cyclobacterium plantarum TaxID=2716263 RepID=A0ABX0H1T2_9BACT|nr:caspase family protein [Cyclobacterium plantarum]NHE55754.1 hypothetical protein [Cyclobacterium plantarum]
MSGGRHLIFQSGFSGHYRIPITSIPNQFRNKRLEMAEQNRGIVSNKKNFNSVTNKPETARTFVLIVAISAYDSGWPALEFPVSDCERLLEVLQRKYQISADPELVSFLKDREATRPAILQKLHSFRKGNDIITPSDNLIVILSGHAYRDELDKKSQPYFAPYDSVPPDPEMDISAFNLLGKKDIMDRLTKIVAKDILVIIDTCYSSTFTPHEIRLPDSVRPTNKSYSPDNPSRWILASGRNEPVPDKSFFTDSLIKILEENTRSHLPVSSINDLIEEQRKEAGIFISSPHCDNSVNADFKGGTFNFVLDDAFQNRKVYIPQPNQHTPKNNLDYSQNQLRKRSILFRSKLLNRHLKGSQIESGLLADTIHTELQQNQVKLDGEPAPLTTSVISLWQQPCTHAILIGNRGSGKTMSILRLWKEFLEKEDYPIPIYVELNEFNHVQKAERKGFILRYIAKNYFDSYPMAESLRNFICQLFFDSIPNSAKSRENPRFVLLLDGFNHVTVPREELTTELSWLSGDGTSIQIIFTSRKVEIQNFNWANKYTVVELVPLQDKQIIAYLNKLDNTNEPDPRLLQFFGNPMMLTLYAGSEVILKKYKEDARFTFFTVRTEAELLWNFREAQFAKLMEEYEGRSHEQLLVRFLLFFYVPFLAWSMEKKGRVSIAWNIATDTDYNFYEVFNKAYEKLNGRTSFSQFQEVWKINEHLPIGQLSDMQKLERSETFLKYLVEHLQLLTKEGNELRFLHPNIRHFFAACHLVNCIRFSLEENLLPKEWKSRVFPVYLRRLIGEMEGEYIFEPQILLRGEQVPARIRNNSVSRLLAQCEGREMKEDFTVCNAVTILHETRGTLAGANLQNIDLRGVVLNGIPMSAFRGKNYLPAKVDGAWIDGELFENPKGLYGILNVDYSLDSKRIVGISGYSEIGEWIAATGKCTFILKLEHSNSVTSAVYNRDRKRILLGYRNGNIKEWSGINGECTKIFSGHSGCVNSVTYNLDDSRILSASSDGTIKEWCARSLECLRIYIGHSDDIKSAVYSLDNKKILSTSRDRSIKEWATETGECLRSFDKQHSGVTSAVYSPDGQKFLFVTGTIIKELSASTGKCISIYEGHYIGMCSAIYSKDGQRILSCAYDKTVKEWSVITGKCIRTFVGHMDIVHKAIYSEDGLRILSCSKSGSIIEWSVETGECLFAVQKGENGIGPSAVYSKNGRCILNSKFTKTFEWSVYKAKCLKIFKGANSTISYSQNGMRIVTVSSDHSLMELKLSTGECTRKFAGHTRKINTLLYSSDDKKILSASDDGTVKEWSVLRGSCQRTININRCVISAVYSPNGSYILSCSADGIAKIWSVWSESSVKVLNDRNCKVHSAVYSPDGQRVLVHNHKPIGSLAELSPSTGDNLKSYKFLEFTRFANYSRDGSRLILGFNSGELQERARSNGKCLTNYVGHDIFICSVDHSRDGKTILSNDSGGTVREWSTTTGKEIRKFISEPGLITQGLDLRNLHPDSKFSEEEKDRLRRYGAIFNDQDAKEWQEAIQDAYGDQTWE